MARLTRASGWLLCMAGTLALAWAVRGAVLQWVALAWQGGPALASWLGVLLTAALGLCVAGLGLAMCRE